MSFTVDIDRYCKDELEYELAVRGIVETGSLIQLRKCLRSALSLESAGQVVHSSVEFDPQSEIQICETKLAEVKQLFRVQLPNVAR